VLECTNLPLYRHAMQAATGMPVFYCNADPLCVRIAACTEEYPHPKIKPRSIVKLKPSLQRLPAQWGSIHGITVLNPTNVHADNDFSSQ